MSLDDKLLPIYLNPLTGLTSGPKFYKYLKSNDLLTIKRGNKIITLTLKDIQTWVNQQRTQQVFQKQPERNKYIYPIRATYPFQRIMIDLMDMTHEVHRTNKLKNGKPVTFLFCAVDVYTRYAFVYPMSAKDTPETLRCLQEMLQGIIKLTGVGIMPDTMEIISDNESSIKGGQVQQFCRELFIKSTFVMHDYKRKSIVERFIRTLRWFIRKYEFALHTTTYIDKLDDIVYNYNHTFHSTIRTTPFDALTNNKKYDLNVRYRIGKLDCMQGIGGADCGKRFKVSTKNKIPTLRTTKATKLQIGSYVRLLRRKPLVEDSKQRRRDLQIRNFAKEDQTFSGKIYRIKAYSGYNYIVEDHNGKQINTPYRRSELQLVADPDANEVPHGFTSDLEQRRNDYRFDDDDDDELEEKEEKEEKEGKEIDSILDQRRRGVDEQNVQRSLAQSEEQFDNNRNLRRSKRVRKPTNQLVGEDGSVLRYDNSDLSAAHLGRGITKKKWSLFIRSLFNPY